MGGDMLAENRVRFALDRNLFVRVDGDLFGFTRCFPPPI